MRRPVKRGSVASCPPGCRVSSADRGGSRRGLLFSQSRDDAIGQVLPAGQAGGRLAGSLVRALTGSGERRVRLRTLTLIRWIAIIGQAFTVALVHFSLEFRLPLGPMLGAIGLGADQPRPLGLRRDHPSDRAQRRPAARLRHPAAGLPPGADRRPAEPVLGPADRAGHPVGDHLSLRTTIVLCLFVVGAATVLALAPSDLPWRPGSFELPPLYIAGPVARARAGHRAGRGLRLADRRRGAAPVGCARGDPDGARPRAAAPRRWAASRPPPRTSSAARSRRSR